MTERSYPFDGGSGAAITEDQWSLLAGAWQDDGVQAHGPWENALKVTSNNEALILHVDEGHANIAGIHYHLDEEKTLAFGANASANSRIDRVVLKLDRVSNTISIQIKTGVAATSPVAPSVDRSWASPEISLATFIVRGNSSAVLPAEVSDERDFIGRYIKVSEDTGSYPRGSIGYDPANDDFYATFSGGPVLLRTGPEPSLAAYLTSANAAATYSVLGHNHDSTYANVNTISNGTIALRSGFNSTYGAIGAWGRMADLSLRVRNSSGVELGNGAVIADITPAAYRPLYTQYAGCLIGSTGTAGIRIDTNGEIVYLGSTIPYTGVSYIHLGITYVRASAATN